MVHRHPQRLAPDGQAWEMTAGTPKILPKNTACPRIYAPGQSNIKRKETCSGRIVLRPLRKEQGNDFRNANIRETWIIKWDNAPRPPPARQGSSAIPWRFALEDDASPPKMRRYLSEARPLMYPPGQTNVKKEGDLRGEG